LICKNKIYFDTSAYNKERRNIENRESVCEIKGEGEREIEVERGREREGE
jgi:hypothetical protein